MKPILKLFPLLGISVMLFSCSQRVSPYQDGTTYDISFKHDGTVKATLHKIKGGFNLTVKGTGRTKSYEDATKTPWHYISKRIIDLKVNEGITTIGNYLFYSLSSVKGCLLPSTITAIGRDGFNENHELYSMSGDGITNACDATIYFYQEEMPEESGKYWHYKYGVPTAWTTLRMLFIGNSFTYYYDIPKLVEGLGKSLNEMIQVDYVVKGSTTLSTHANHTSETGVKVQNFLNSTDDYKYVVLQEQSTTPYTNYNNFKNGASSLASDVKNTQKNCKVVLYSTWGYKEAADSQSQTIPELEETIRNNYIKCANEVNNIDDVNFVGPAFSKIFTDYQNISLYHTDNKHPSKYGAYLSACVHILSMIKDINIDETDFFGTKPGTYVNTVDPGAQSPTNFGDGIDETTARTLIEVAKDTVTRYTINIDDGSDE